MGLEAKIERSGGKLQTLSPAKQHELQCWLIDELTVLAEALGESVTAARLRIYAYDLSDLPRPQLETAFIRALRESKFFPKLPELRDMAGAGAQQVREAEAEEAWNFVNVYLRNWGVNLTPFYSRGNRIEAPALHPRINYSLRAIGGLWALNQITTESRPWVKRDFLQAYETAPVAQSLALSSSGKSPLSRLLGEVKRLAADKKMGDTKVSEDTKANEKEASDV